MIWQRNRPLILGHRGASAHAPDNTLVAFRLALAVGADGVELDVRRTADDALVVFHDALVDGNAIVDTPLSGLRSRWPEIPTLAEALDVLAGAVVNIEIKNFPHEPDFDPDHRVATSVLRLVADMGLNEQVLISSFNPGTVDHLRSSTTEVALGQLLVGGLTGPEAVASAAERGLQAVHPTDAAADAELLEAAEGAGIAVVVWTVNDPDRAQSLAAGGAAGLISDDPGLIRETLGLSGEGN